MSVGYLVFQKCSHSAGIISKCTILRTIKIFCELRNPWKHILDYHASLSFSGNTFDLKKAYNTMVWYGTSRQIIGTVQNYLVVFAQTFSAARFSYSARLPRHWFETYIDPERRFLTNIPQIHLIQMSNALKNTSGFFPLHSNLADLESFREEEGNSRKLYGPVNALVLTGTV